MVKPDDICGVCGTQRDEHGDLNHEFNPDGQLIPLKKGPEPTKKPPIHRDDAQHEALVKRMNEDQLTQTVLRLIDVLTKHDVLKAQDLIYVLGGYDANHRRSAGKDAAGDHSPSQPE